MTKTILDRIKAYKLEEVAADKAAKTLEAVEAEAKAADPVRPFAKALKTAAIEGYGLIAEIKKASPSKGLIREDFDPPSLARAYAEGGAQHPRRRAAQGAALRNAGALPVVYG